MPMREQTGVRGYTWCGQSSRLGRTSHQGWRPAIKAGEFVGHRDHGILELHDSVRQLVGNEM